MFTEVIIFLYQLIALLFNMIIPILLLMLIVWIFIKMSTGFIRSIKR